MRVSASRGRICDGSDVVGQDVTPAVRVRSARDPGRMPGMGCRSPMKRGRTQADARQVSCQTGDALIIIDCMNDLEFPGGEQVLPWAMKLVPKLVRFRGRAHAAGMPVAYANDNFKHWHGNFDDVYKRCTRPGVRG